MVMATIFVIQEGYYSIW